mmetsp:Transcript_26784/g.55910  ORF Transcript_26784/g.55910 Transcript_26784/m.55910 type:complete len:225 (+) Transcript_26784:649-1323(+)
MLVNHILPMLWILDNMQQRLHIPRMRRVMRPVAPRALLLLGLVRPSRFPFLLRVFPSPVEGLEAPVDDVGREAAVVVEPAFDVEHGVVVVFVFGVEAVVGGVSFWFEVDEDIGIIPPFQRKRPPVQHAPALVQNHLPRLHRHIVRPPVVPVYLQRPRLVDVLRHVDDRAQHQRQPIDVRGEDGAIGVLAYAVEGGGGEFLGRPLLEGVAGHFPDGVFEFGTASG